MMLLRSLAMLAVLLLGTPFVPGQETVDVNAGRGDVSLYVPEDYSDDEPMPLVVILHGYTGSGSGIESYWDMESQAEEDGFLLAYPDGTVDGLGNPFWNATDGCCGGSSTVDDSTYLMELIGEVQVQYTVDTRRIYVSGHSNGGFMSHRLACDHSETIAAIGSLAGAVYDDADDCFADFPVHVLQVHGTSDFVILYDGGSTFFGPYPGAEETVETWAELNGCTLDAEDGDDLDLAALIAGDETSVTRYVTDCDAGGSAELWSIDGGSHSPAFTSDWAELLVEYFYDHPKNCETISHRTQTSRLIDDDSSGSAEFGASIALSGPWLVVGAPRDEVDDSANAGALSVYRREGRIWTFHAKLTADDPASNHRFATAVATDGGRILAGAPRSDGGETDAGSATIFKRTPSGWMVDAELVADEPVEFAEYGTSVAIQGDVAIVGAHRNSSPDANAGSVFVYRLEEGTWSLEQELVASDGESGDRFGNALAFDGTTIAVGARFWDGDETNSGAVYVFTHDGDSWVEDDIVSASDAGSGDNFGLALAIDGDRLVVGASNHDDPFSNAGAAYIFELDGGSWTEQQKLTASDSSSLDGFGTAVAIDGDHIVVTADFADSDHGRGYVFRYDEDTIEWTELRVVDGTRREEDGGFGRSLAVDGGAIAIGAPVTSRGEVSLFLLADCNGNDLRDSCDIEDGTSEDCNLNGIPDECETVEPVIAIDPESWQVDVGDSVTFSVAATVGPDVTYQWRLDEVAIVDATSAELVIDEVAESDAGNYDVVVTDACGEVTSESAQLSLVEPAVFLRGDTDSSGVVSALVDALNLLDVYFGDGIALPCRDAADLDDSGEIGPLIDALTLLLWGFMDGPEPAAPGVEECGVDPTDDDLDCQDPPDSCP